MGLACIITGHNYVLQYTTSYKRYRATDHKYHNAIDYSYRCTKCGDIYTERKWIT
jgi:hypothetical protein